MGSIEKRKRAARGSAEIEVRVNPKTGKRTYYTRYVEADGYRRHVLVSKVSMDDAVKNRRAILARVDAGKVGRAVHTPEEKARARTTVRELAEKFCGKNDEWKTGHGGATRRPERYRREAWSVFKCHVLKFVGDMVAAEVKPRDVVRMRDGLQAKRKHARTVQRSQRHLSLLFSWAIEHGHLDCANPCSDVKAPQPKSSSSFYTATEVARMLDKAAELAPDLHGCIAFAFYTGCRKGEIAALRAGDCDLDGGRIIVSRSWEEDARKSGEPVTVQVHPHLDAILRPLLQGKMPDELMFPDPLGGGMRPKYNAGEAERNLWGLDEILDMAKIRKPLRPWHSFRHSHGTALAASGAGLAEIQEALGQSSLEMARRYTRVAAAQVRERIHALPSIGPLLPTKVVSITTARQPAPKDTVRTRHRTVAS